MSIKDDIKKRAGERIANIEKAVSDIDWIPEFENGEGILTVGEGFRIGFPFNRVLMEENRKHMESLGFKVVSEYSEKQAAQEWWAPSQTFEKDGHRIELSYWPWAEGATCQRRSLGKVKQDVEIFEFACEPVTA